ncbi:MAG: hypothetical protein IKA59_02445 [Clostridia bacterium]|nr:hypothetical protein [Clostridia bacterium]
MRVYKLQGKAKCVFCGEGADLYIDEIHVTVCRKCGVALYKNLGEHFVPRAVPNVILRSEKQYKPLSHIFEDAKDQKAEETEEKIINETAKEENIKSTKENKIKKIFLQIKSKIKQTKMKRRNK